MVSRVLRTLRAGLTMLVAVAVAITIVQATPAGDTERLEGAGASGLADLGDLQLIAAPPSCTKINKETTAAAAGEKRCIALYKMSTRRRLAMACMKVLVDLYTRNQCGGGKGVQVEAIAQARAIGKFNDDRVMGHTSGSGITPDIQWELTFNGARADILLYDHTVGTDPDEGTPDPGPPDTVNIIEVKVQGNGYDLEQTEAQAQRYVNAFPGPAQLYTFPGGYDDSFSVEDPDHPCPNGGGQRIRNYTVSSPRDGVLWVERGKDKCTNRPNPVPTSTVTPEPTSVPVPTQHPRDRVYENVPINRDANHNGVDDFWDFIRDHPELDDLFQLPKELPTLDLAHPSIITGITAGALAVLANSLLASGAAGAGAGAVAVGEAVAVAVGAAAVGFIFTVGASWQS